MAGTYTYDPGDLTTDLAKVRLLIRDTTQPLSAANALLSDEEIQFFLDTEMNVYMAAYHAGLAILAKAKGLAEKRIGTLWLKWENWMEGHLPELRRRGSAHQFAEAGAVSIDDIDVLMDNEDWPVRAVVRGMHDHPGAEPRNLEKDLS